MFFSSVDAQKCMCTERGSYCDDPLKTSTCCAFCGLLHFNQDPSGFCNDVKFKSINMVLMVEKKYCMQPRSLIEK